MALTQEDGGVVLVDNTKNGGKKGKNRMRALICQCHRVATEFMEQGFYCMHLQAILAPLIWKRRKHLFMFWQSIQLPSRSYCAPESLGILSDTQKGMNVLYVFFPTSPAWISLMLWVITNGTGCLYTDSSINRRMLRQQRWNSPG